MTLKARGVRETLFAISYVSSSKREGPFSTKIVERFEAYGERLTGSFGELWDLLVMVSVFVQLWNYTFHPIPGSPAVPRKEDPLYVEATGCHFELSHGL